MNIDYGYTGKMLRVNLTTGVITEFSSAKYLPKYLGGRGLAARIYWDEIGPEVEPFDPENKLIFATGPMNGTGAYAASKCTVACKSPKHQPKHSFATSDASDLSPALKRAGYDALIIEGKAEKPVYLWIDDGKTEIRDAQDLWGRLTFDTREILWDRHGKNTSVSCIGPAGENLSVFATIGTSMNSCFVKCGAGAVMGSKKLKAFVCYGKNKVKIANPQGILERNKFRHPRFTIKIGETRIVNGQEIVGVARDPNKMTSLAAQPDTKFGDYAKIGRVQLKTYGCESCPMQCRHKFGFPGGEMIDGVAKCGGLLTWLYPENLKYGGKPYGDVTYKTNRLCDQLGLDAFLTVSPAAYVGYLGEFHKDDEYGYAIYSDVFLQLHNMGVLTKENTGLDWDNFGSYDFISQFLTQIAYREGFGDAVSQGFAKMKDYIISNEKFGPHRHEAQYIWERCEPKAGPFGAIQYNHGVFHPNPLRQMYGAVSDEGGQEPEAYWNGFEGFFDPMPDTVLEKWLGSSKVKDGYYWGPEVATAAINHEQNAMIVDSLDMCCFCDTGQLLTYMPFYMPHRIWPLVDWETELVKDSPSGGAEYLSAIFSETITNDDLMKVSERLVNLVRACWVRDGYGKGDDTYHDSHFELTSKSDRSNGYMNPRVKFEETIEEYYKQRGWKDAVPTRAKLEELDLKDVADDLDARGLLTE